MSPGSLSRRGFLAAGAPALLAAAGVGYAVQRAPDDEVARTVPARREAVSVPVILQPRSLAAVMADVDATAGRRLLGSPWGTWAGSVPDAWGAAYVGWLLRATTGGPVVTTPTALRDSFTATGRLQSTPVVGSVVLYAWGESVAPHHAGLVVSVKGGVAQTIEGNHPYSVPSAERFVRRLVRPGPGVITYGMPAYAP